MNIAAIGQGRPKKTTPLNAMEFIGPTGNVVVELVPNALVKAETIAMKTAGYHQRENKRLAMRRLPQSVSRRQYSRRILKAHNMSWT